MAESLTLSTPFWTLFHAMLRNEKGNAAEHSRARECCSWMTAELNALQKCCTPEEADLIGDINEAWRTLKHIDAPSYALVKQNLQVLGDPAKEERLREYEDIAKELPRLHAEDLPAMLAQKDEEIRTARVLKALQGAVTICRSGSSIKDPITKESVPVKGPNDAIRYFMQRLDVGFGVPTTNPTHGVLGKDAAQVIEIYNEAANPLATKGAVVPFGIQALDKQLKARKGHFVGLLGYAGSGKTRLGRTWCYNAAMAGFSILHFSLEQTYQEELIRYAIIHSHNPIWGKDDEWHLSISDFENNRLSAKHRNFMERELIPDILGGKTIQGRLAIRQPSGGNTWDELKALISVSDRTFPLDMVFLDYLTMCGTKSNRNAREETEANIQDAKSLAMTFNGGEGLLMVSPVQGNRDGLAEAAKAQGRWEMSGVYMFSGFDKALDLCLSVYSDDDLDAESQVLVGTAKYRRGKNLSPVRLGVKHSSGTFHDIEGSRDVKERTLDEAMEDL